MVFTRLQVFPPSTWHKLCLCSIVLLNLCVFQYGVFIVPVISLVFVQFCASTWCKMNKG